MKGQNSPYLDKLRKNLFKIFTLIIIIYSTIIISLYQYYNDKVDMTKAQILQTNYNKIVEVSMNKLFSLAYYTSIRDKDIEDM